MPKRNDPENEMWGQVTDSDFTNICYKYLVDF